MRKIVRTILLLLSWVHWSDSVSWCSPFFLTQRADVSRFQVHGINGRNGRSTGSSDTRSFINTWSSVGRGGGRSDADELKDKDTVSKEGVSIASGSLFDALLDARSKARLLIVFLPAVPSARRGHVTASFDQMALSSLLSETVHSVSERIFRGSKKTKSNQKSFGSFMTWSSPHGSPNYQGAVSVIRRLKGISPLGNKASPYLLVLYPAQVLDAQTGKPKIVPRLLAQHHCNPPPTADSMASWLLALRQRHKKLYATMHRDLAEMEFFRERVEGYSQSVLENKAMEEKERLEEEQRIEGERIERERLEAMEARRKSLLKSLPDEPGVQEDGVITIALRFPDGKSGKRRFLQDTKLCVVFDWVDAMYGIEREKVELSTMTGRRTFDLPSTDHSMTLRDAGLGKLAGLRVRIRETSDIGADENEQDNSGTNDEEDGGDEER